MIRLKSIHLQIIEKATRERFNHATSLVLRAMFKATDNKQLTLDDVRSGKRLILGFHNNQLTPK